MQRRAAVNLARAPWRASERPANAAARCRLASCCGAAEAHRLEIGRLFYLCVITDARAAAASAAAAPITLIPHSMPERKDFNLKPIRCTPPEQQCRWYIFTSFNSGAVAKVHPSRWLPAQHPITPAREWRKQTGRTRQRSFSTESSFRTTLLLICWRLQNLARFHFHFQQPSKTIIYMWAIDSIQQKNNIIIFVAVLRLKTGTLNYYYLIYYQRILLYN